MPQFKGSLDRVFTVNADIATVASTMSDPEVFSRFIEDLETIEPIEEGTWRWQLRELSEKGVRFKADYTVKYTRYGDRHLEWATISRGNMTSSGSASFTELGRNTRVAYSETIVCDMDVNRLLAKIIKPIVDRQIARGVDGYLERVKAHLESA